MGKVESDVYFLGGNDVVFIHFSIMTRKRPIYMRVMDDCGFSTSSNLKILGIIIIIIIIIWENFIYLTNLRVFLHFFIIQNISLWYIKL
jgi:hypothetical protein